MALLGWVQEDPRAGRGGIQKGPIPRRTHEKSRSGCKNCKQRHVKCDETIPECDRCSRAGVDCDYHNGKPYRKCSSTQSSSLTVDIASLSTYDCKTGSHLNLHAMGAAISAMAGDSREDSMKSVGLTRLLSHFAEDALTTLGSPKAQNIMRTKMPRLAQEHPFLLHSVLAFSATHLGEWESCRHVFTASATYHMSRALCLYLGQMDSITDLQTLDAMLSTCMILTSLAYYGAINDTSDSWIFGTHSTSHYDWLTVTSGLGFLLRQAEAQRYIHESFWLPIIIESDAFNGPNLPSGSREAFNLPALLADVCGIGDAVNEMNPYDKPFRILDTMFSFPTRGQSFPKLMSYPCRLESKFVALVHEKDHVALLLLSYWFALMCKLPHWWCRRRVQHECQSICRYLHMFATRAIKELLEVPKEACHLESMSVDLA
ncbi:hypothetical protein PV11_07071 [Exophiala sideris]|uniref:Zn(2)-C6 fungal-type domain-containing protein n=1 Tax=Exophiala sideris TaxID=1016849 RepID=A0A0D1YFA7_9EURO|nr:hypothetical protein PV11_07071 [Exophiala sideris]